MMITAPAKISGVRWSLRIGASRNVRPNTGAGLRWLQALLILFAFSTGSVFAQSSRRECLQFRGNIVGASANVPGVSVGDRFTVTVTYDPGVPDIWPNDPAVGFFQFNGQTSQIAVRVRSEERRVGKECRL